MKQQRFGLFDSHIDLAHRYWKGIAAAGAIAIDATCGNGHDTLALAQQLLSDNSGELYAMDLQEEALAAARKKIEALLPPSIAQRIHYIAGCHSRFPSHIAPGSVELIVYNLGYYPGGDKSITTQVETTLASLAAAAPLIKNGGAISITCYPGHEEGAREEKQLLAAISSWDRELWSCSHQRWINRHPLSPTLLFLQKSLWGVAPHPRKGACPLSTPFV